MTVTQPPFDDLQESDIEEQAALWFLRLRSSGSVDSIGLRKWLESDERHRKALDDVKAAWDVFETEKVAPEVLRLRSEALEAAHVAGAGRWKSPSRSRFNIDRRGIAAGLTGLFLLPLLGWGIKNAQAEVIRTGVAERKSVTLADNSRVDLDANSEVSVSFSSSVRGVRLVRGRANFKVSKDAKRPFVVSAGGNAVTALGTEFSVEKRNTEISVTLVEGQISIKQIADGARQAKMLSSLKPAQMVVFKDGEAPTAITDIDPERALSWRKGVLFFDNERLGDVVNRLNDYSSTKIELKGSYISNLRISGTFMVGKTNAFVDAMSTYYHLDVVNSGGTMTISSKI